MRNNASQPRSGEEEYPTSAMIAILLSSLPISRKTERRFFHLQRPSAFTASFPNKINGNAALESVRIVSMIKMILLPVEGSFRPLDLYLLPL